jgi:hypothetical protein
VPNHFARNPSRERTFSACSPHGCQDPPDGLNGALTSRVARQPDHEDVRSDQHTGETLEGGAYHPPLHGDLDYAAKKNAEVQALRR